VVVAAGVVLLGTATQLVLSEGSRKTIAIGKERLVAVAPLPQIGGEMCAPEDLMAAASAPPNLMTIRQQQSSPAGTATSSAAPPRPSETPRTDVDKRKPVSTLRDPRNSFAGLVIDPARNEVIMAEENNFSILVYDRMENTPPRAAFSEPKRMIQGENTYLEYACGVYLDPATGDIYGINNDTLNWMTVFDRNAKGNTAPNRKLATPHTTFAMVADEENHELLMTIQDDHAVVTFKKMAKE
jgi:hypothetical protein